MALNQTIRNSYTVTIGIETHVQLKTKSKLFSNASNDARDAPPNSLINHIDLGLPGALPVLNKAAIDLATKAALAFGVPPQKFSKFDRKHYFYPDLPNGYQITQFYHPVIKGGSVSFELGGEKKNVNIHEAHLEADAGKSTHPIGKDYSLVDLNRVGTPLLEIVSEPEIHSPAEAKAYARELQLLVKYTGVSDASLFYGNMRFDVNVSVSKDPNILGTRTETKNLNSFKSVEKAAEYEIIRQIELLESGERIVQETRGWDDAKQKTFSQRSKEESHDYRYMPDPDLPPIILDDEFIEKVKQNMPELPGEYRKYFKQIGIDPSTVEALIDIPDNARFVKSLHSQFGDDVAKRIANWFVNLAGESENGEKKINYASVEMAGKLAAMVSENKLSSTAAKEVWLEMYATGRDPELLATEKNLLQISDKSEIIKIVDRVLFDNPKAAADVQKGEMKAIGFLIGQVMKQSKGKANPSLASQLIKQQLGL